MVVALEWVPLSGLQDWICPLIDRWICCTYFWALSTRPTSVKCQVQRLSYHHVPLHFHMASFLATITIDFGESIQLFTSVVFSRNKRHRVYENVTDIPGGVLGHVVGFPDRRADISLLVLLITCLCTVTFFYLPSALFSSVPYKERLFI